VSSTTVTERYWAEQHTHYGDGWCELYWDSRGLASRQAVLTQLHLLPEWRTLVELGCHSGPMLGVIAAAFPDAQLTGVEVNPVAADAARKNVPSAEIITKGMCAWIVDQPDKSFDVLVTHYTLAYVSPVDLPAMLWNATRVANHLVLAEPILERGEGKDVGQHGYHEWMHPYGETLKALGYKYRLVPCDVVQCLNGLVIV
jgi:SAM-dependent methyltransferase